MPRTVGMKELVMKTMSKDTHTQIDRRQLENEKFFELKSKEYRDGIKRKETR